MALSGCGKGRKSVPGLENIAIGVVSSRLNVSFVSKTLNWDYGVTLPIPNLKDALVSISPQVLGQTGTVFLFSISLDSLQKDGKPFALSGLPDGRPLPDVRGGKLPRWDVTIHRLNLSLYLSNEAFGIFVPLDFISPEGLALPEIISIPIQDSRGNLLGRAYAMPSNVSGSGSGLYLLLPYLGGQPNLAH